MKKKSLSALFLFFGLSSLAFGAGDAEPISYFAIILEALGIHDHLLVHELLPVCGALFSLFMITMFGLIYRSSVSRAGDDLAPAAGLSVRSFFESILDFVWDLGENIIGKHDAKTFIPLLCGIFLFIFISNASGLIPGISPATGSLNTNLAMGFTVFFVYNFYGLKANGIGYLKHFLGPVWWLAPLFLVIELVSHLVRPFSLSLRLYGNIFGDHLVLSVLTGLVPLIVPLVSLLFGTLVVVLQSLVFTLLSSIYISMAITHEDH